MLDIIEKAEVANASGDMDAARSSDPASTHRMRGLWDMSVCLAIGLFEVAYLHD